MLQRSCSNKSSQFANHCPAYLACSHEVQQVRSVYSDHAHVGNVGHCLIPSTLSIEIGMYTYTSYRNLFRLHAGQTFFNHVSISAMSQKRSLRSVGQLLWWLRVPKVTHLTWLVCCHLKWVQVLFCSFYSATCFLSVARAYSRLKSAIFMI